MAEEFERDSGGFRGRGRRGGDYGGGGFNGLAPDRGRKKAQRCRFCREQSEYIDFKDLQAVTKQCTAQGKLFSRKRSGNCARHQRMVNGAVKRARYMALMPFVG
ncbi:30S ribosomal protein S18 [bacterium]|nr:30S ribosomal protein S18 [bacterium]